MRTKHNDHHILWILLFSGTIFLVPFFAAAHIPLFAEPERAADVIPIERPEVSHAFYGELQGFPHTFEVRASESFRLYAQILQPDIPSSEHNISGIIIKEVPESGRVAEVARLHAADAPWDPFFEFFGGDHYVRGPSFEKVVDSGVYRIEVSTPDNIGKYVLVVGKTEDFSGIGYFETVRRIAGVKEFFGKSQFRIIESPFVYVPLLVLLGMFGVYWFWRRRRAGGAPVV